MMHHFVNELYNFYRNDRDIATFNKLSNEKY